MAMRIERKGPRPPLTPRVEQFLREKLGGISLDDVTDPEDRRPDYSCLQGRLIVEIKTLEDDASERVGNITDELEKRPDWPVFFGTVPLEACIENLEGDQDRLRLDIINRIGRSTIRHLRKANKQLADGCFDGSAQTAVRMVILVNEDHADYDPQTVAYVVQHELKRWSGKTPELANIDSVVYLSERHATVQGTLLVLPILSVEGYGGKVSPWKADVVDQVATAWGEWNGFPVIQHDDGAPEFETIEIIPDKMPLHEKWRIEYRRQPYFRHLSFEKLRDEFDEVVTMTLLFGMKDSPRKITPQQAMPAFERWTHIMEELQHRKIPMDKLPHDRDRMIDAAKRMNAGGDVIEWIAELKSRTD